jgi:hypothetical protein
VSGSADNTVRLIAIPEGLGDNGAFYTYAVCGVGLRLTLLSVVELYYYGRASSILHSICRRTSTLHARYYLVSILVKNASPPKPAEFAILLLELRQHRYLD